MSLILKRIIMVFLGVMGAFIVWPCLLTIQYFQMSFPGFFQFSLAQGMAFGLVFGAIFGSFEGIIVSSRNKAFTGMLFGAIAGTAAGAIGVTVGQSFLFYSGDIILSSMGNIKNIALIAANGVAWVLIGIFVSMIEGFRSRSIRKTIVGLFGGIVGGLIGGMTLQMHLYFFPGQPYALLGGLVIFGFSLSYFYSTFENRFSLGAIKLLNGPLKNREYNLVKNKISIGSLNSCDIVLTGYHNVAPLHAWITIKKGRVLFTPATNATQNKGLTLVNGATVVMVNDEKKEESTLRREDVFSVGSAKFMYGVFS